MEVRLTHIGGPTLLIEFGGWRLLTDPTFDPAGGKYSFSLGIGSVKLSAPALSPGEIGAIDAVLLSHDHHEDNLDAAGRALLPSAGAVITTVPGAKRLGGNARGLGFWDRTTLEAPGKPTIEIVATPCRHGPPLSKPLVGDVIGFGLTWEGQAHGAFWISGDTVLYPGVREVAERLDVGTAVVHLGGVRFPISGPLHYTMTGAQAAELLAAIKPRTTIPIHYEGWKHFREGRDKVEAALAEAPADLRESVRWLDIGVATEVEV